MVGKRGKKMIIVGTIGIQRGKAEVHNLDSRSLTAICAPDEASDTEDEEAEAISVVGRAATRSKSAHRGG